jgi:RNA polymerase sigma-32 factor
MTKALDLRMNLPIGSLEAYCQAVEHIPILSREEERALALRLKREGDRDAAWRLVMSHLRFVVRIARGYQGYGLSQADLVQEGNIGLMKAVKRFDPEVGVRLVSFAVHWIRAEIHEFILRNWRIVKVATTKAQRKLFFNLRSSKKRLGWMNSREVQEVANDLGVSPEDVIEMEQRLNAHDAAFDPLVEPEGEAEQLTPAGYIQDMRFEPASRNEELDWETRSTDKLRAALEKLDERSRTIIERRWLNEQKSTLHELAATYGISAERIRQLEENAIKKMRSAMAEA